ncbi:HPF/RaiA family ribosome-associated protein [Gemmatimonas sp.]|uniref:HPF/RaiA family ribosome-associated protein n=1 Tax=Gemmatimonas sp. TaxID=1962908 RepID=UPI00286B7E61|nr:HPF/RaiA family ribosome-associated protein [Gemmatimonas sp.]
MEIILHAHHAEVTESLRAQAEAAVIRLAKRLHRVANAIVRFVGDGETRRVEIVLQRARSKELFVHADARAFAPALSAAVHRLESQVSRVRRSRRVPTEGDRTG